MGLQDFLLQEIEVLATFQVLAPFQNIALPAYSNISLEVNQISRLQFCACTDCLYCSYYIASFKNEENRCTVYDKTFEGKIVAFRLEICIVIHGKSLHCSMLVDLYC